MTVTTDLFGGLMHPVGDVLNSAGGHDAKVE